MSELVPYYFYSIMLVGIYFICTLVNLWCLLVMAFLVFDVLVLDKTIIFFNKTKAYKRRKKFRVIKGDKKDVN